MPALQYGYHTKRARVIGLAGSGKTIFEKQDAYFWEKYDDNVFKKHGFFNSLPGV